MSEQFTAPMIESPAVSSEAPSESASLEGQSAAPAEGAAPAAVQDKIESLEAKPNPTKAEKKMLRELKIKFNGKDYTESLPFEIEDNQANRDYMTKQLQMSRLAQSKSADFAALQKQAYQLVEDLQKNPRKVLQNPNLGIDVKKLAAEIIEEEFANSQKSPDQLEREKLQQELKALKEDRENEKKTFQEKERERMTTEAANRYDQEFTAAISASDLPKSPYVVKKMAELMSIAVSENLDVSASDVMPLVREQIVNDIKEMFGAMPEDVIESIVGKDIFNKVRKKNIANAKQKQAPTTLKGSVQDIGAKKAPAPAKPADKISYRKFFGPGV